MPVTTAATLRRPFIHSDERTNTTSPTRSLTSTAAAAFLEDRVMWAPMKSSRPAWKAGGAKAGTRPRGDTRLLWSGLPGSNRPTQLGRLEPDHSAKPSWKLELIPHRNRQPMHPRGRWGALSQRCRWSAVSMRRLREPSSVAKWSRSRRAPNRIRFAVAELHCMSACFAFWLRSAMDSTPQTDCRRHAPTHPTKGRGQRVCACRKSNEKAR